MRVSFRQVLLLVFSWSVMFSVYLATWITLPKLTCILGPHLPKPINELDELGRCLESHLYFVSSIRFVHGQMVFCDASCDSYKREELGCLVLVRLCMPTSRNVAG